MSQSLWITARRVLGVYFLIIAALNVPTAIAVLGYEDAGIRRWALLIVPLGQGLVALVAGWWLLRGSVSVAEEHNTESNPAFLAPVLLLMGMYFVVEGLSDAVAEIVEMYSFGEAWQIRTGNFAGAAVTLLAGVGLVTRPNTIARKIAGLAKRSA